MSAFDKLTRQAGEQLGEPVLAAAMVVPPGATLYKGYQPKSKSLAFGGPIAAAIASKAESTGGGMAAGVPGKQGVLALTAHRVVYFKKKTLGTGVGDQLAEWPRADISSIEHDQPSKHAYPGLLLTFADGSTCAMFGEQRWGLRELADAWSR